MRFLIFADLHAFFRENVGKITEEFDIIVFLGDINGMDIRYILNTFPDKPAYGVLGNHDTKDLFDTANNFLVMERKMMQKPLLYPIKDIHLKNIDDYELSFTGFQGSFKYKSTALGFTQEEAFSLKIPVVDILFSHETGYQYFEGQSKHCSHAGLKAISKYINEYQPKYHFFGHHHRDIQFQKGKTKCFGVYGCSIFDSNTEKIKKIF